MSHIDRKNINLLELLLVRRSLATCASPEIFGVMNMNRHLTGSPRLCEMACDFTAGLYTPYRCESGWSNEVGSRQLELGNNSSLDETHDTFYAQSRWLLDAAVRILREGSVRRLQVFKSLELADLEDVPQGSAWKTSRLSETSCNDGDGRHWWPMPGPSLWKIIPGKIPLYLNFECMFRTKNHLEHHKSAVW